jgi:tetratricopeptide (TPR) repeat protein
VPKQLARYDVFIGSPGGLAEERTAFKAVIDKFNDLHGIPNGVLFRAVGWEDTLAGVGRPQELINAELRQCDYAFFILHDKWGSPTGSYSSGTEEEYFVALEAYERANLLNICIFFKNVAPEKLSDPGPNLSNVLRFRKKIETERRHLYKSFGDKAEFSVIIEAHLADFLRSHLGKAVGDRAINLPTPVEPEVGPRVERPTDFAFYLEQGRRLKSASGAERAAVLYFANEAARLATGSRERIDALELQIEAHTFRRDYAAALAISDQLILLRPEVSPEEALEIELIRIDLLVQLSRWGEVLREVPAMSAGAARKVKKSLRLGTAKKLLHRASALDGSGDHTEEEATYRQVVELLTSRQDLSAITLRALAIRNLAITLYQTGQHQEALVAVEQFDTDIPDGDDEWIMASRIGLATVRGECFRLTGSGAEELETYDRVVRTYIDAPGDDVALQLSSVMLKRGLILGQDGLDELAIAAYDALIERFLLSQVPGVRDRVARALSLKASRLYHIRSYEKELQTLDELVDRYEGDTSEDALREVSSALQRKAVTLSILGRPDEEIYVLDQLISRFSQSGDEEIVKNVAIAFVSRGLTLSNKGSYLEEIANYDQGVAVLSEKSVSSVSDQIAKLYYYKAMTYFQMAQLDEVIRVVDQAVVRFGGAARPATRLEIIRASILKARALELSDKRAEAERALDRLLLVYEGEDVPEVVDVLLAAMNAKARMLDEGGRKSAALMSLDEIISFGRTERLDRNIEVASAMRRKAVILIGEGDKESAHRMLSEIVELFRHDDTPKMVSLVTAAEAGLREG